MRYLMTLALLPAGAAIAQATVTSTRIEAAEWRCRDSSGAVLSSQARVDKAQKNCTGDPTLAAPGRLSEMRPSGNRTGAVRVAAGPGPEPAPTPHPAPDPATTNPADVPLSFNDSVFANATSGTSRITLPPGSSRSDLSIVENSGDPTITCNDSCSLTRVRIQSREGVRCVSGTINLTWVYVTATGIGDDHADAVQCYSPGSTGTVTVKNSTFKMAGVANAGYFSADDWRGSHVFENVLFEGGNYGLRIPADGGSSVSLKNVYFVRGSFAYGAFLFDVIKGRRINIVQWENVRWASWRDDQLVLGPPIPRPR